MTATDHADTKPEHAAFCTKRDSDICKFARICATFRQTFKHYACCPVHRTDTITYHMGPFAIPPPEMKTRLA